MKINTKQADGTVVAIEVADEDVMATGLFMPTSKFQEELTRRGVGIATSKGYVKPEDMTSDQITALAASKGVKLPAESAGDPGATATAIQDAIAKKRSEWERSDMKPRDEKIQTLESDNEDLLQKQLFSEIIRAAASVGVEKSLLKGATKNAEAPIVSMLASAFAYDTETKQFYVLSEDGEGFVFSDRPTQDHPYKDAEEFVEQWAADKANAKFIEVTSQRGPNLQGTVGGGRGPVGQVHISKADSRILPRLRAAQAEAVKRGLDAHEGVVIDG